MCQGSALMDTPAVWPWVEVETKGSFFFFLVFLGPHLWHMEDPRLGVESELLLPAYATAMATPDP